MINEIHYVAIKYLMTDTFLANSMNSTASRIYWFKLAGIFKKACRALKT